MEQLREAMRGYMEQLAQEALRNQDQQQAQQMDPDAMQLSQDQLQQLLDRIEELANSGQQEQAEALLEQLRQMLENLQMQITQGGQNGQQEGPADAAGIAGHPAPAAGSGPMTVSRSCSASSTKAASSRASRASSKANSRAKASSRGRASNRARASRARACSPGRCPVPRNSPRRQEALRQMLDDLRGRLPGPSTDEGTTAREQLGEAEDQMGAARDNLDEGDLDGALDRQADAMDALREGIRNLGEEMQQPGPAAAGRQSRPARRRLCPR